MNVGEIAPSAAGDENLLSWTLGKFKHGNAPSPPARFNRAHEPGCPRAKDQGIIFLTA